MGDGDAEKADAGALSSDRGHASALDWATGLWNRLNAYYGNPETAAIQHDARVLLLRYAADNGGSASLLKQWRHDLGLWNDADWRDARAELARLRAVAGSKVKQ